MAPDKFSPLICGSVTYYYRTQMANSFPKTKIGIKDGFFIATARARSTHPRWQPDPDNPKNYYVMVSPYNYPSCYNCNDFGQGTYTVFHNVADGNRTVTPSDMAAIDAKMDDGVPGTGTVIAGSFPSGNTGATALPLATCSSGDNYLMSNSGYQCTPLIEIGVFSGINR